ncbi:telomere-associated protein RIF1 [Drosophila grimshawi]|uniref:GH21278 n=1 Tax=Drosophila grimshawi TaxID=7222 RepID=B4J7V0_DROGR|nr:telomere-associated protein RIF1 [Drosophila grimshawi]EDW01156.1 GH21278 [Drosophila grimshawi]
MDIDAEVGQAYHTVQLSAKEMLKNNRRQHYCNMIDLLASSCKASGLLATSFTNEELVQFWLGDILPLMFDTDRNIQNCTVAAMAEALVALDVAVIHAAKCWPQVRSEFVNNYTTLIGDMRDAKNNNWHKIWTLLVQIMDSELLRGCTYINKFLAVVELGFRNPDNGVRSEAFLCWRVLIKIFAAYNELAAGKRLRLLLIPLRTSQSRSSHVSSIKVRVWWYLITCLDTELPKSFDNAVEYFLSFLFGGGARGNATGLAHTYQTARELALPCLVALWNVEPRSQSLERMLRDMRLEVLSQPSPLMSAELLQQHWRPMLAAAVVAMQLLSEQENNSASEQELLHLLLRNLTMAMCQLRVAPFTIACCSELEKMLPDSDGSIVRSVFNTCAALAMPPQRVDSLEVLEAYMKLCLKARTEVPPAILQRCVSLIYAPEQLEARNTIEFRQLGQFAELLMQSNDEEDYETFGVKLHMWRQISVTLLNYLRDNPLEYRVTHNATLVDNWILWPLQTCASFAGRRTHNNFFDGAFCELWRQLINAGHNANERKRFVVELKTTLLDLLKQSSKEESHFADLFDIYVGAVLKLGICKDAPLYKDVFGLLQAVLERPTLSQSLLEGCLNTLRNVILELRQNELMVVFDALKPTLVAVLQCWTKGKCEGSFLNEWKRSILDKFRKLSMKSMANQLKDLFKGDDLYVIIPSVWSLNPDKLTDRQKERFAEKSDIPALYNDMSQSQDSSIKPWTPKKVVIAKSKQSELAIGGEREQDIGSDNVIIIDESPPDLLTTPAALSTPSSTEKYNFRKPRTQPEDESSKSSTTAEEATTVRQKRKRGAQKDNSLELPTTATDKLRSPRKKTDSAPAPAAAGKASAQKVKETAKLTPMQSEDLFAEFATPTPITVPAAAPATATQPSELAKKTEPSVPETQLSVSPEPAVESLAASTQMPSELMAESSPRKANTRLCNLNSPPDRKQTNNSTSPTLRPKPSAHLTGRGAQLINMIRNKKLDATGAPTLSSSSASGSTATAASAATTRSQVTNARLIERSELIATPTNELNELATAVEHTSTPIQAKDLLIFSKRLPSPSASPSASILKRKLRCESMDDFESPAQKRKRVSFHDPPVSVTKEYLRDVDETRSSKPKRCLLLDKLAQTAGGGGGGGGGVGQEMRPALKRRGRLDSIIEIEKFAHEHTARSADVDKSMDKSHDAVEDEAFVSLKWNETTITHNNNSSRSVEKQLPDVETEAPVATSGSRDLAILDGESALDLVVEQCSLDSVLERYFAKPNSTPAKSALHLAKFLSNQMKGNEKLKTNVLETLSENHSKDFLDHAVRENLSSVVCDRLNPNSVLEYICAKSKINNTCRSNLLAQVPAMIRLEAERFALLQHLLQQCSFADDQLLDLIGQLIRMRDNNPSAERNNCATAAGVGNNVNDDNVAETAADSSSNL